MLIFEWWNIIHQLPHRHDNTHHKHMMLTQTHYKWRMERKLPITAFLLQYAHTGTVINRNNSHSPSLINCWWWWHFAILLPCYKTWTKLVNMAFKVNLIQVCDIFNSEYTVLFLNYWFTECTLNVSNMQYKDQSWHCLGWNIEITNILFDRF